MNAAGQFPQLDQGLAGLLRGRLDQELKPRVGSGGPVAGHPQRQAQRDKALLGAIVQVALEARRRSASASLDDPRPRRARTCSS